MALAHNQDRIYTIDDIYELPESTRAEIIDGKIYYQAAPSSIHQRILSDLHATIHQYIKSKGGLCTIYPAPFAVFIKPHDDRFYVEPDLSIICDLSKINKKGCKGAPDWIIEITSPSDPSHDYITKLALYKATGVKEYWIINPQSKSIAIYYFESENFLSTYSFKDKIKVNIYDDLYIDFSELNI